MFPASTTYKKEKKKKVVVHLFRHQHDCTQLSLLNATPITKKDDPFLLPRKNDQENYSNPVKWQTSYTERFEGEYVEYKDDQCCGTEEKTIFH